MIMNDKEKIPRSVQLMSGAYVEPGVYIEENVILGPNSVILAHTGNGPVTQVMNGAIIGANSTVLPGVSVGEKARVEPGTLVDRSVPPYAIVTGNPAYISGYIEAFSSNSEPQNITKDVNTYSSVQSTRVEGVTLHQLPMVPDMRGSLSVGEFEREVPFIPKRYFLVFDVPSAETRGEHAHFQCKQFLVAVKGSVSVVADNGVSREEFILNKPDMGLYLPAMTWGIQYRYTEDAVLMVFASDFYDNSDYIREYSEFKKLIQRQGENGEFN